MLAITINWNLKLAWKQFPEFVDTNVILFGYLLDEGNNLPTRSRVKATCGLVQEENLGSSNKLTSNTDPSLLSSTDTFSNGSSNNSICLLSETERLDKSINSSHSFGLRQSATNRSAGFALLGRASYFL